MPLLIALIDALVDSALIAAVLTFAMGFLAAISLLGAVAFTARALSDSVKALCGVRERVIRRIYKNHDGTEVIEEIPYQPATNLLTGVVQEVSRKRLEHH